MPNVLTLVDINADRPMERELLIRYNVVLSGNYVQAVRGSDVGEVLKLETVVGNFSPRQYFGAKGAARVYALNGPAGFSVELLPGANGNHWLLKMFASAGNEHAAGAYEAAITGDLDFTIEASARSFD